MKRFLMILGLAIIIVIPGFFLLNHFFHFTEEGSTTASKTQVSSTTNSAIHVFPNTNGAKSVDKIDQMIEKMTLAEKVGQLFLARVPEENQTQDLEKWGLGGYLLFGRDVEKESAAGLKEKIASYRKASKLPLLVAADEEGGTVTRISVNPNLVAAPFKSPQELMATGGLAGVREDTKKKAAILNSYGINTGLFPDADVATDANAFIYDRTTGQDAKKTSEYVETVVKALNEAQSGSTLKHFPGYGNNQDSHVEIVTDDRSLAELEKNDFLPFEAGIKAGADSILVSHNIVTAIDKTQPASISKPVHDILRKQLKFTGVIMTDDMDMAGLADFISQEKAGLAALQAGNDLILSSTYGLQIPYIIQAVENGEYSEAQLNASVKRVLTWKEKLGLLATKD